MRNNFSFKKLFTLVELLIVIVVLGILAAIIIPNIASFSDEAKQTRLVADLRNTQTAVDNYHLKLGEYPTVDGKKPVFVNEPVVWDKLVHDYLRQEPKLEKDQTVYIDPYGGVTLGYNSHAYFLRWLKDSDFIVEDPSSPSYSGMNPPIGSVLSNYNTDTKKFETFDNKTRIMTFTTAMTGDALLEAYLATNDEEFLNRAKLVGGYLMTLTHEKSYYAYDFTLIASGTDYDKATNTWNTYYGESYTKDVAVTAHFLIELSRQTGDTSYAERGKALLETLIETQKLIAEDPSRHSIFGALPEKFSISGTSASPSWVYYHKSKDTGAETIHPMVLPTDLAVMVFDAGNSGYTYSGTGFSVEDRNRYLKMKNDYFNFLEYAFTSLNGLSSDGLPYEFISTDSEGNFIGVNVDQIAANRNIVDHVGPDMGFTTDQQFYLVLGLIKQNSPSADKIYQTISEKLYTGDLFYGQYTPSGDPYTVDGTTGGRVPKETINSALYLEMAKYKNPALARELELDMIDVMIKKDGDKILDAAQAWAPGEIIIEDLVSAYVPKSILFQRSFDNVIYK